MTFYNLIQRITYRAGKLHAQLISLKPNIIIGEGTIVEPGVVITTQYGGSISIGCNCYISRGAQLLTHGGFIEIGDNCTINPCTIIYGQGDTHIGSNVRIAAHCVIVPANHIYTDISVPIYLQGLSKKGIFIEDDVWLGSGVKVLDGVTIKRGCVIGANSVVNKNTEQYCIYVGVPAKKIKSRI